MRFIPIITEAWKIDGGVAFGVIPRSLWSKLYATPDENNLIPMVNRCLLVETSDRLILIDTGFGNKRDEKYYQFKYIIERNPIKQAIIKAGYEPTEVTDVIFTHLHDDHCGGAVTRKPDGSPEIVFPNARHWVSSTQWESAMHPNKREAAAYFADNVSPLAEAGLLKFVDVEGELFTGINVMLRNGHTAGQMLPIIENGSETLVYAADFIPSIAHVAPVWIASVDVLPIVALQEKEIFLRQAADHHWQLFFEHDAANERCSIAENVKGFVGITAD